MKNVRKPNPWPGLFGSLTFFGAWVYCMGEYGFLLGFGFGWVPAAILAVIVLAAAQMVADGL